MPILELRCKENMTRDEDEISMELSSSKPSVLDKIDCKDKPLDDSLTNLQWLQECKINIQEIASNISFPYSPAPSVSSDESRSDGEGDFDFTPRCSRSFFGEDEKIDYKTNPHVKPPYSYATLICMAMKAANTPKMTLSAIYRWITENYVYYKYAEPSWQNSIRHNLSLNKCFMKVPRKKGDPGKGGYWRLVSEYADKLLESSARKRRASHEIRSHSPQFSKRQRIEKFPKPKSSYLMEPKEEEQSIKSMVNAYINPCSEYFTNQDTSSHIDHTYGKLVDVSQIEETKIKQEDNEEEEVFKDDDDQLTDEDMDIYPEALKEDFSWSSIGVDELGESMHLLQQELLEARTGAFVNSPFFGFPGYETSSPFCLSPPPSADDVGCPVNFTDELNLTIVGRSMRIHTPTPSLVNELRNAYIKEEPLSPVDDEALWTNDIDLHSFPQAELCLN